MAMTLEQFKDVSRQVRDFEKAEIPFNVSFVSLDTNDPTAPYMFLPVNMRFDNYARLHYAYDYFKGTIPFSGQNSLYIAGANLDSAAGQVNEIVSRAYYEANYKYINFSSIPSWRFYPTEAIKQLSGYGNAFPAELHVWAILHDLPEVVEKGITYRTLWTTRGGQSSMLCCVPHTHKFYNYLDKDSYFVTFDKNKEDDRVLITNELTFDTWLVIVACYLYPRGISQLTNQCYVNSALAKPMRIRLEKLIPKEKRALYDNYKRAAQLEFEKQQSDNVLGKLLQKKIGAAVYNDIKLETRKATYETVSIQANDFLETVKTNTAFDDRTDIYMLIRNYMSPKFKELQAAVLPAPVEGVEKPGPSFNLTINNIPIVVSRTPDNTRRYVNGFPINIVEVEQVVFRASCFFDAELYDAFLKEVSRMSLLWHDVLANGLKVKIGNVDANGFNKAEAPPESPRLRFKKIGREVHIVLQEDKTAKVKFTKLLGLVKTLNRKINGRTVYLGYKYIKKDGNWGAQELRSIIKECTTFEVKKKNTKGVETVEKVELLNDADTEYLTKLAEEAQKIAIEKSKKFLETAVKATGAVEENFNGQPMMIVQGKLRKYAICKATNRVFNYDSKKSICIVEPGHTVGVGFDHLASRLYALRNDSVLVEKIGTLRHG